MNRTERATGRRLIRGVLAAVAGAIIAPAVLVLDDLSVLGSGSTVLIASLAGGVVGGVLGLVLEDVEWRKLWNS